MLKQDLIPTTQYPLKSPYVMNPKGVCIHNTANDASAKNERDYLARADNKNEVSFHIAIDDKEAIQCIPLNRNAWASGDGANGEGNRNYIHIEICYSLSAGERFNQAEKRTAKEVALLLKEYNWNISNVKKHQDFAKKYCPHRTLDLGWNRFLNMIQEELNNLNAPTKIDEVKNIEATVTTSEKITNQYKESGVFTASEKIYFRNNVGINNSNKIEGFYSKGETVKYDTVVITNKYVYISWISASAKTRRYMPVREINNGKYGPVWGVIK